MKAAVARRVLVTLIVFAVVAGCTEPQESGPVDLNNDSDRNGIPDDQERNMSEVTANDTRMPGLSPV